MLSPQPLITAPLRHDCRPSFIGPPPEPFRSLAVRRFSSHFRVRQRQRVTSSSRAPPWSSIECAWSTPRLPPCTAGDGPARMLRRQRRAQTRQARVLLRLDRTVRRSPALNARDPALSRVCRPSSWCRVTVSHRSDYPSLYRLDAACIMSLQHD